MTLFLPSKPARAARSLALLGALVLLPWGLAGAGEPDYEAVSDRLLKAVASGELSPEQAEAMMGKLAKVRFAERVAELKARGKLGSAKGKRKRKEQKKAKQAWGKALEAKLMKFGLPKGALGKFRHALTQAGVSGERQDKALGAVLKLAHVWRQDPKADHDAFHAEVKRYLVGELQLSGEQVGLVFGLAKETFAANQAGAKSQGKRAKLREHYAKLGLKGPAFERVSASLRGAGFEGAQLDQALSGLARLLHGQLKPDAPQDALRGALAKHLEKSGFEKAQVEHMLGLAERLRSHLAQRAGEPGVVAAKLAKAYAERGVGAEVLGKVRHRLGQFGLSEKQSEGALGGILGVLEGLEAKGEGYELEPRLRGYFQKELGLSEKQLEQVLNLARRLSQLDKSR